MMTFFPWLACAVLLIIAIGLADQNQRLRHQLAVANKLPPITRGLDNVYLEPVNLGPLPNVTLSIGGLVIIGNAAAKPVLQVTLTARNIGAPTTLDQWGLVLVRAPIDSNGIHVMGMRAAANSPDLPALDERVSSTPFSGSLTGFVFFTSPFSAAEIMDGIKSRDLSLFVRVHASDNAGHVWETQRSLVEMADEAMSNSTGTQAVRR